MMSCKMCFTESELVSGKLPLIVVWQLGGVNKCVIIPHSAFNDLPTNLILGFLEGETSQLLWIKWWLNTNTSFLWMYWHYQTNMVLCYSLSSDYGLWNILLLTLFDIQCSAFLFYFEMEVWLPVSLCSRFCFCTILLGAFNSVLDDVLAC